MAARLPRAALTLLCAVAVIYGTALFPAAFDVELQAEQPAASAPASPTPDAAETATTVATATETAETDTPEPTPEPTPPPTAAGSGSERRGGGLDAGWLGAALAVAAFALFGGAVVWLLRKADAPSGLGFSLPSIPRIPLLGSLHRIPQLTTALLISGGSGVARVVSDLGTLGRQFAGALGRVAGPAARITSGTLFAAPAALLSTAALPFRAMSGAGSVFGALPSLGGLTGRGGDTPDADVRERVSVEPSTGEDESEPVPSVTAAWEAMTDLVPVRNPSATTPAEYARAAVDHGLPEGPVTRLTRLFREVRYGGRPESQDRLTAARRALDALLGGDD